MTCDRLGILPAMTTAKYKTTQAHMHIDTCYLLQIPKAKGSRPLPHPRPQPPHFPLNIEKPYLAQPCNHDTTKKQHCFSLSLLLFVLHRLPFRSLPTGFTWTFPKYSCCLPRPLMSIAVTSLLAHKYGCLQWSNYTAECSMRKCIDACSI